MALFMTKKELFKWQQIVMPNTSKLTMNKQQLQRASKQRASNIIKIITDSINLVNTTLKPDVFFKRLQLVQEKSYELTLLEPYMKFSGTSPTQSYHEIVAKKQRAIYDFIERYFYSDIEPKVKSLKSADAKLRHYQRFYDSLSLHFDIMDTDIVNYIEELYESGTSKLTENMK